MATRIKSVARNEPAKTSEEDIRDTLHDESLAIEHASTIPAAGEEKSRVRLKTHALLAQSMEWYGNHDIINIHDVLAEQQEELKKLQEEEFQKEQASHILKFRQALLNILNEKFFDPPIHDIEARIRGYSPQKALRKTYDYLQQLYEAQYQPNIPTNRVKDLQTVVLNGNWKTVRGIEKTRDQVIKLLFK